MTLAWRYAARTDVGLVRSRNEDSGYAGPNLLVLADGMGGHAAGNVASSIAVAEMVHLDAEADGADQAMQLSGRALHDANEALREAVRRDGALRGMGTTLTALMRTGDQVVLTHIGDSRAYLARDGVLSQISRDHSFVQALVDEGRLSPDDAMHHPQRSLVTRVLTGHDGDDPDLSVRQARAGDRYLLCSDGLSDYVAQDTIGQVLLSEPETGCAADRLVQLALKAGAPDNVTCIVADVADVVDPDASPSATVEVVGAAAERPSSDTQAMPQTPAAKAAALTRSVTADGADAGGSDAVDAGAADATGVHRAVVLEPTAGDRDHAPAPRGPVLAEEGSTGRLRAIRGVGLVVLVLVALGGAGYAAYAWSQQQWFVGEARGHVAIYQGVNQRVASLRLSHVAVETEIAMSDLPPYYGTRLSATIDATSQANARSIVLNLSGEALRCQQAKAAGRSCGDA